jgi:hypothetical protein
MIFADLTTFQNHPLFSLDKRTISATLLVVRYYYYLLLASGFDLVRPNMHACTERLTMRSHIAQAMQDQSARQVCRPIEGDFSSHVYDCLNMDVPVKKPGGGGRAAVSSTSLVSVKSADLGPVRRPHRK